MKTAKKAKKKKPTKQAIMKRWVAALRSGRYRQTTGKLRARNKAGNATNNFCCLGVLCDLYAQDHPEAGWVAKKDEYSDMKSRCAFSAEKKAPLDAENATTTLPQFVKEWAGIKDSGGLFLLSQPALTALVGTKGEEQPLYQRSIDLVELNDNHNFSFKQLAAVIEKHWRKL